MVQRFEADGEVKVDGAGFGENQAESALGGDDFGVCRGRPVRQ